MRFCLLVATLLIIASCTGMNASESLLATLRGKVIAGPTCPDQINPSGCEEQPVAAASLVVLDSQGQEITQVRTDERGQFSVNLQPGRYYLLPKLVPRLMGTPERIEVVVDKMELTPVTIKYDTGIRSIKPTSF